MPTSKKIVLLLSGGIDSSTLLALAKERGMDVLALAVDYGQRHYREMDAALAIGTYYSTPITGANISNLARIMRSCQTDLSVPVPHGHYTDENMKATVTPNRNMLMLSIATAYAISMGVQTVAYAAHAGDHAIYPDCRPSFVGGMRAVMQLCHYEAIDLWTPFLYQTKSDIVREGLRMRVPYELTWSCYEGGIVACGKCGTCVERLEAFQLNNVKDPIMYRKEPSA